MSAAHLGTERLFVAVGVPDQVRSALHEALSPLRRRWPDLRWARPESWHVTLAFVGPCDPRRAGAVEAAAGVAAAGVAPFEVRLSGGLGTFGSTVLWAGLEPSTALTSLAAGLRGALADRGIEIEQRPFHAHLTLARAPRRRRLPAGAGRAEWQGPVLAWTARQVRVMRSEPAQAGAARYVTRRALALTGGP